VEADRAKLRERCASLERRDAELAVKISQTEKEACDLQSVNSTLERQVGESAVACQIAKDRLASVQRDYESVDARYKDTVMKQRSLMECAEAAAAQSSALEKENYRLDNLCSNIRRRCVLPLPYHGQHQEIDPAVDIGHRTQIVFTSSASASNLH
jgi:chromosome segregation ATPase